jgi:pimeloyl-ACP methyl ester carboxylesterase
MKTALELNEKILIISKEIREKYPDLLKYLNEMPITIPYEENPTLTVKTLSSYYDSLLKVVEGYQNHLPEIVQPENDLHLPIPEIIKLEQDTSYQNLLTAVNDFTISYNDIGEGRTPILFLHGYPFDKSMWKGQLDSLKSSHRLIAIDIRGFGQSIDEKSALSIDMFGKDLIEFMDKLGIKKAIICGLSMGGFIALNVMKEFPSRFEALVLCDTQCIADTIEVKENRYSTIEQINIDGADEFKEKFIKSVFHPDSLTSKMELVESLRYVVFANSNSIINAGLTALAERSETCSNLNSICIPTLIICGREDKVTPLVQSEYMHNQIGGSILKIIDNAGHVSNLEQPNVFNKYLVDFLDSLPTLN